MYTFIYNYNKDLDDFNMYFHFFLNHLLGVILVLVLFCVFVWIVALKFYRLLITSISLLLMKLSWWCRKLMKEFTTENVWTAVARVVHLHFYFPVLKTTVAFRCSKGQRQDSCSTIFWGSFRKIKSFKNKLKECISEE